MIQNLAPIALLIVSAAADEPPSIRASGNLAQYVTSDDYPVQALIAEEEGAVVFRLDIDGAGRVERCAVLDSSGSVALDAATCRIMSARVRMTPARDKAGRPTTDQVISSIRWTLPEGSPPSEAFDRWFGCVGEAMQARIVTSLPVVAVVDQSIAKCAALQTAEVLDDLRHDMAVGAPGGAASDDDVRAYVRDGMLKAISDIRASRPD